MPMTPAHRAAFTRLLTVSKWRWRGYAATIGADHPDAVKVREEFEVLKQLKENKMKHIELTITWGDRPESKIAIDPRTITAVRDYGAGRQVHYGEGHIDNVSDTYAEIMTKIKEAESCE